MINHGIITGALFILLGFLYKRRHTYDIAELKGLQTVGPGVRRRLHPRHAGVDRRARASTASSASSSCCSAPSSSHRWWAVVAATGVILAALYLLWAYQRVFHGEPDEDNATFPDLKLTERLVMVPLIVLIVFLGVYPKPVLDRIEPSVEPPARPRRGGQPRRRPRLPRRRHRGRREPRAGRPTRSASTAASRAGTPTSRVDASRRDGGGPMTACSPSLARRRSAPTRIATPQIDWRGAAARADPPRRRHPPADHRLAHAASGAATRWYAPYTVVVAVAAGCRAAAAVGPGAGLGHAAVVGHAGIAARARSRTVGRRRRRRRLRPVRHRRDLRRRGPRRAAGRRLPAP